MMKLKFLLLFLFTLGILALFPTTARADGIIIPDPPPCEFCPPPPCPEPGLCPAPSPMVQLAIRYHRVTVAIEEQVAVTHVDQVFYNPNDWAVEGVYVFPIPPEAAVSDFTLWVDGEPVAGEVLDAEQARRTYEEIVTALKDPALLEYAGRGALRARIFPIPPQGERRIELEYTQALPAENGLVRYVYPLNTEKFSALPLEEVSVSVEVRASQPIRAVYSPSHPVAVSRESEFRARAGYEARDVLPDSDFALYYSIGESEAFHLLSYRDPSDPSDPDGFFLLLLAPRPDQSRAPIPKDVLLVLDRSGSMEGEKFLQAQEALRYILQHLNPDDRFNILTFSTGIERYADTLRPASEGNEALPWVDRLRAEGSTDINRALLEAASLASGERPTYLIFLTDGLPTEGVVDSQQILDNLAADVPQNLSLFAFGVGYDVDTFLLDSLAQANHGSSSYVLPGERLDEILSGFYARISTPVLTNLSLDFGDLAAYDIYPEPLPDLFLGSQIVVVGRYREGGAAEIHLSGLVNGESQVFRYPDEGFDRDSRGRSAAIASLPRLWATRKIGFLLNRTRLQGADQETIDQIVRLSIRYGIVTPYTSYLVTEPLPLGAAEQERIAAEAFSQLQAIGTAPASGQAAVEKAAVQGSLAGADAAAAPPAEAAQSVRIVGARTFVHNAGVWADTAFDPGEMQPVKVAFLSQDYFALVEARPELAAAFALGPAVIAVSDGMAYEVGPAGTATGPVDIPAAYTPEPDEAVPPVTPPSVVTPDVERTPALAPGTLPCTGGLLAPLPLLLGLWVARNHRRTSR
jgi:Ca-activated chloride channel family protein